MAREPREYTRQDRDKVIQLYKEQKGLMDIVVELNIPYSTVHRFLTDADITLRARGRRQKYSGKERERLRTEVVRLYEEGKGLVEISLHNTIRDITGQKIGTGLVSQLLDEANIPRRKQGHRKA
ncbi:hypothetical protein [Alkalihalobacillus sp. TS-13]|uniref:hypothetical protein n=1 Tax=Alkalihalobacillus sp. TS-13 TaxID=2842455 RepID=UPI001C879CB0|nr:hypothetical protein [Alkalihalobacillus sp. TS-13]